jgi:hypothetical protein
MKNKFTSNFMHVLMCIAFGILFVASVAGTTMIGYAVFHFMDSQK